MKQDIKDGAALRRLLDAGGSSVLIDKRPDEPMYLVHADWAGGVAVGIGPSLAEAANKARSVISDDAPKDFGQQDVLGGEP